MGVCQGKWRRLRPSGSEHACFPASPATLTSLLLPRSALPASMLWDGYSSSMKFLLHGSLAMTTHFHPSGLRVCLRLCPLQVSLCLISLSTCFFFFFFFQCISRFLIMYWWMCLPRLDFKPHEGRVLVYRVCPSLWLNPTWSRVWELVCLAAFQAPPLLPHCCSQRWAGSLASTPGSAIYPPLVKFLSLHPLSFSSLNGTSKNFLSQL